MIALTQAEHSALLAARDERDERARAMADQSIQQLACIVIDEATRRGLILTIEQRPLTPLAMGHHETVISVREARR